MITIKLASVTHAKEMTAAIAARRRELAKAHAAAMKADVQSAAEKVHERMKTLDQIDTDLKEALEK